MPKAKIATAREVKLNLWCIEMAMRWPVHHSGAYAGAAVGAIYPPKNEIDADVLGRAAKIRAWVKSA